MSEQSSKALVRRGDAGHRPGHPRRGAEGHPGDGGADRDHRDVFHRVAGGRLAEGWWNWDTPGLLQQLGAIPAEQTA